MEEMIILGGLALISFFVLHVWKRFRHSESPVIVAAKTAPIGCLGSIAGGALAVGAAMLVPTDSFSPEIYKVFHASIYIFVLLVALMAGLFLLNRSILFLIPDKTKFSNVHSYSIAYFFVIAMALFVRGFLALPTQELESPSYETVPIPGIEEQIQFGSVTTNSFFGESNFVLKVQWPDGQTIEFNPVLVNVGGTPTVAIYYLAPGKEGLRRGVLFENDHEQKILDLDSRVMLTLNTIIGYATSYPRADTSAEEWNNIKTRKFIGTYQSGHFFKASVVSDPMLHKIAPRQ